MAVIKEIRSPDMDRSNRIPPGQRLANRFPVLHHGSIQIINPSTWTFSIIGLVDREKTLGFAEFQALPRVRVLSDIHCVTTWSLLGNTWEGVSTGIIRDLVKIDPEAKYVLVHAAAGFTTNLPITDFFAEDVLFAFTWNGEPLTAAHGAPVRLVVPRLYFWKSAKWASGVEFMERDRPGFWESVGYHNHGDPWKEERYG